MYWLCGGNKVDVKLYLKSFSKITNVPVCVYGAGQYEYMSDEETIYDSIKKKIYAYALKQASGLHWLNGWLLFYKLEYEENVIVLGPCMSYQPTDFRTVFMMLSSKMFLTKEEVDIVYKQWIGKRIITYIFFKESINLLSLGLLGEEYEENTFPIQEHKQVNPERNVIENVETEWSDQNLKYVEMMKYIIKNGLVEDLKEMFKTEQPAPYGTLGPNELRHYKNSMMIHIYIVRCAAHEGGVDEELGIRLAEAYSQQCEAAKSVKELNEISQKIRMDFCQRANQAQALSCNNLTITKAMQYIHGHRMEKLDAKIVANALGLSASYLCHEFKKETGMSIVSFIHTEKMKLAKKMLLFTDYSLGEISAYLSFSSQSYFQSVFKKMERMTPKEFKNREKLKEL